MAIIYSYPTVTPTSDDLVLGTDVNGEGKPTKNFTIQSIVDIVQGGATGLGAVLTISSDALQQPATNFTNVQGTGTSTFGSFTDGTMTISSGVGTGFTAFTSTAITGTLQTAAQPNVTSLGNLTGLVINGAISGTNVITSTTLVGASNTNIASTLAIKTYVDSNPSGAESLAATLLIGNTTSGTDIAISAADDITFTDTSKIIMGAGGDTTIEHDGTDFKITTITGKNTVSNTSGDIDITASATGKKININGKAGVDLKHDGSTKLQAISGGVQVTGVVDVPNGTSGAPTYSFTTDTNTGMFRSAADTVAFSSGGNLTMTISTSGVTTEGELTAIGQFRCLSSAQAVFSGQVTVALAPSANTDAASKAYVDGEVSAKTLDYAGDATGPFALNLSTDDLEFNGDSNITVTAAAVAATKGIVTIDLNNDVGISGTMTAGTFTDGTFTGSSGTYTGYTSITSAAFVGPLTGNATTATALATAGTIQLLSGSGATQGVASNAVTYTSGGDVQLTTTLADTTVTAKALTNLPTPTSSAIASTDTILAAMAKLQGQITGIAGSLAFEGTWDARTVAEGGAGTPPSATPVNGQFWIVSVAGSQNLDGITDWLVGDWAIYVSNGAGTDAWQKLDQSNEVLGSGAANKIAKWTSANTLATGLISDDGTTVTIGTNGNLTVQGDTILGDSATDDTVTLNGPTTFESTGRFKQGLALGTATDGSEYGATGQVLTTGAAAGSPPTWTTPTVGVVTSITGDYGITVAGTAAVPTIAVTSDANNLINQATAKATPIGTDTILINDSQTASAVLKKSTISSLPLDNYTSWTLAGDTGTSQAITSGNTATIAGGTGITTAASATDTLTVNIDTVGTDNAIEVLTAATAATGDFMWFSDIDDSNTLRKSTLANLPFVPAVSGTQYTIPMFATSSTLDDSIISQNAGATEAIINGTLASTVKVKIGSTGNPIYILQDPRGGSNNIDDNLFITDRSTAPPNSSGGARGIVAVGNLALENITGVGDASYGTWQTAVGVKALNSATTGYGNTAVGYLAGSNMTTGKRNIIVGLEAGQNISTGGDSVAIGYDAIGVSGTLTGDYNTAVGESAGGYLSGGSEKNVFLGYRAGYRMAADSVKNICIGDESGPFNGFPTNIQNTIWLGTRSSTVAENATNNTINIGNNDHTVMLRGGSSAIDIGSATLPWGDLYVDNGFFDGNLTVDGNIIHGGGGVFSGDQSVTSAGGATLAFTLTRATTGTLIFDVWFTSETSKETSVAKKYVVARGTGSGGTPVYNKIIDTGPSLYPNNNNTTDFTVSFIDDPAAATAGTSILCKITVTGTNSSGSALTQNIGYTIQVGHDSTNALTFTAAS